MISGKVVRGDGYGRKLGFPTANLDTKEDLPEPGVYSGNVMIKGDEDHVIYRAGIVIGPEINNEKKVEAHLIGFSGDLYGREVSLEIDKFIRPYKNFGSEEELINQIKEDISKC